MMSISLFLPISLFKATPGCVPEPAQNVLSFVLIGLFLEDTGCVKTERGCGRVGVLLPSISILRQTSLHFVSLLPCNGEEESQWETGSDFLRISDRHCCV